MWVKWTLGGGNMNTLGVNINYPFTEGKMLFHSTWHTYAFTNSSIFTVCRRINNNIWLYPQETEKWRKFFYGHSAYNGTFGRGHQFIGPSLPLRFSDINTKHLDFSIEINTIFSRSPPYIPFYPHINIIENTLIYRENHLNNY